MAKKCRALWLLLLSLLVVLCMGFVACGDDEGGNNENPPAAVSAATLTYDGAVIKWQPVSNATSYTLTINGQSYTSYNNGQYQFPYTTVTADNYVIAIKANNSYGSSEEVSRGFQKLAAPENVLFSTEGEMSWAAVMGAASYIVEVNNVEKPTDLPVFNDFAYGQRNNIRIKAVGGPDTFAVWSNVYQKEYLAAPSNITYDGQYLTWTGANNAVGYTLYVNGMEHPNINSNKYLYDSGNHDFEVELRSEGNGQTIFPSKLCEKKSFVFLGAAENLRVDDDGALVWDVVEKANSYLVKMANVNGSQSEQVVNEPKIDLREGEQTTVQIKPQSNGDATYFSTFSEAKTFALLRSPVLQWNDDFALTDGNEATALTWNPPTGDIVGYNVKIVFTPADGSAKTERVASATAGNPSYSDSYRSIGKYEIQVQSLSNPGSDWSNSKYSQAITVIRLAAPKRVADDSFIVSDSTDVSKGFTVNFQGVSGASSYALWKDGAKTTITAGKGQTSISVNQVIDATTTIEVNSHYALQAIGSVTTVNNAIVATLGSLDSDSLPIDITVAAAPSAASLDIVGGSIIWDSVPGVSNYAVNTGTGSVETVSTNGYSLRNITTVGNHEIAVCSAGNGKNVLPSNYSKSFSVYKLHKPINIKIGTTENEGKLSWEWGDPYSQGFKVFVNGDETAIPNTNIDNMNQYVKDGGVAVVVQATGDRWNQDKTVYYTDSDKSDVRTFKKLAEVTFPSPYINGTRLIWNAPSNVTSSTNVSYQVFRDGYLLNQRMDGASMDLADLGAGTYTFKVRCIGDGITTINSDYSQEVTLRRLETPTVTRTKTQYVWNSVAGASQYQIYIGDRLSNTFDQGPSQFAETPRFDDLSEQTVRVIAVGSPEGGVMDSKPFELTQKITKLPAPSFNYSYDKDNYAPDGNITMKITSVNANISSYVFTRNGVESSAQTSTAFAFTTDSATTYTMSVKAMGGTFDEEGTYWADSLASKNKQVVIFATPNVSNISINQDGEISGFAITDVRTYVLTISYTNGTPDNVQTVSSAVYQDSNAQFIHSITIVSKGNISANQEVDYDIAYISSAAVRWTKV